MTEIVTFIGVVGSGKDYQADILVKKGFVRIDFKDELLDMASDLLGYDVREHYDWFKEHPVGLRWDDNPLLRDLAHRASHEMVRLGIPTGRVFLQRLGTEVMRKRDKDYWTKAWCRKAYANITAGRSVTVADCRFMNEVEAIQNMRAPCRFVFCDYHSGRYDTTLIHASEHLAQELLKAGLQDGQEIKAEHFDVVRGADNVALVV